MAYRETSYDEAEILLKISLSRLKEMGIYPSSLLKDSTYWHKAIIKAQDSADYVNLILFDPLGPSRRDQIIEAIQREIISAGYTKNGK